MQGFFITMYLQSRGVEQQLNEPFRQSEKKKEALQDQWLAREIHIKNWAPNFDCTTVSHARKLSMKPVDLAIIDVFQ